MPTPVSSTVTRKPPGLNFRRDGHPPAAIGEFHRIGKQVDDDLLERTAVGDDLVARLPDDLPEIVADSRAFKQIMINLLSNAVKFTDRGGRVAVTAKVETDGFLVTIEDTGVGISADDLPRIGRPFFQSRSAYDRRHDGTGLGFSIVKGLVRLHGGEVTIASQLGEGTCVTVRLPLDCKIMQPIRKTSNVAHPLFDRASEPAEILTKKTA